MERWQVDKFDWLKLGRMHLLERSAHTLTVNTHKVSLTSVWFPTEIIRPWSKVFSHSHFLQVCKTALANANCFHVLCPCDARYLPKYGSFGHPFRRTPFWVHSIRKCLTSSFDKSPTALKKKKRAHKEKQWSDNSLTDYQVFMKQFSTAPPSVSYTACKYTLDLSSCKVTSCSKMAVLQKTNKQTSHFRQRKRSYNHDWHPNIHRCPKCPAKSQLQTGTEIWKTNV